MLKVPGSGPLNARIVIVGEAPGEDEEIFGRPFIGTSGRELDRMLKEVGIRREECYVTNVCKYRPPGNDMDSWCHTRKAVGKKDGFMQFGGRWCHPLVMEGLEELKSELAWEPQIIIGLGNMALWAFTGEWGVGKWRGSEMKALRGCNFVPTIHPAAVMRNWASRPYVINDLQRVKRRLTNGFFTPKWNFSIFPSFDEVMAFLDGLNGDTAWDIETSKGMMVCCGIATSETRAMCIPFKGPDGVSWTHDQYHAIVAKIQQVKSSQKIKVVGQNWNYDAQYFAEDLQLRFLNDFDTLIAQSVLFPGVERDLGFLSSMYCDWHCYWKDDGKEWKTGIKDFDKEFRYNCRDACATWGVAQKQKSMLLQAKLMSQFQERMDYSVNVFDMMRRGVNRDAGRVAKMDTEVSEAIHARTLLVAERAGKPVNFASPKQVGDLFYKQLGCKAAIKRGTGRTSVDDEALNKIIKSHPQHADIALAILESRSLNSIRSNFLKAQDDPDGRFRSSWMATGTETFRLTSGGNAFHRGGPLQNVTDGKHTSSGRPLPNLRSTIVPDQGCTVFNCDLERADLQVVIWEADDRDMMQKLREHVDVHTENAKDLFGLTAPTEQQRHFGKKFVHLTNYGGSARTCAIGVGCTVHEAELRQRRWFEIHPGILDWHRRTQAYLLGTRTVTNKFGYRRIYFDRVDSLLPEALAWVPQSTVSILISLMQMAIDDQLAGRAPIIMQGHDSLIGQYLTAHEDDILPRIQAASHIAVPYDEPLYIPLELATSTSSWGEVQKRAWPV